MRLMPSTVKKIARPGRVDIHHSVLMKRRPSATIEPHAGVGGSTPKPKKLKEASIKITEPTLSVDTTTVEAKTLGSIS